MRNDARPVGNQSTVESQQSTDSPQSTERRQSVDSRQSATHDRQPHVVNRGAEADARPDDAAVDPVMPTGDSTLKTNI